MTVRAGRRRKCQISLATPSSDLTGMPTLLTGDCLPSEMLDADGSCPAQSGGGDIDVSSDSSGTSRLALEVVDFTTDNDPTNGTAEVWTPVDYSSAGGNNIYVWYHSVTTDSQPAANDAYGSENVWGSNYKLVSHDGGKTDSTSNGHDGTAYGTNITNSATGKLGDASEFNGTDDYYNLGDSDDFSFTDGSGNDEAFSVSAWVNADDATRFNVLAKWDKSTSVNREWYFGSDYSDKAALWLFTSSTGKYIFRYASIALSGSAWKFLTATYSGSELPTGVKLYTDGSVIGSGATYSGSYTGMENTAQSLYIGAMLGSAGSYYTDGKIDEVRIISAELTAEWISQEYSNQNAPGTFGSAGTPEHVIADINETLTIAASTALSSATVVSFNASVSVAGSGSMSDGTIISAQDAASLAGSGAVSAASLIAAANILALDGSQSMNMAATIAAVNALSLALSSSMAPGSIITAQNPFALPGIAAVEVSESAVLAAGISLANQAAVSASGQTDAVGTLTLSQLGGIAIISTAMQTAGLTMANLSSFTIAPSVISGTFVLPDGRSITIAYENRTITVPDN